jgi:BlaI family transcriptional regulator, penicillinase repressor
MNGKSRVAEAAGDAALYLSKRERQILDVVYERGEATADEITAGIPHPPTQDAVRRLIRILEEKGHLRHRKDGLRHIYLPTVTGEKARARALDHMIKTYFHGSASQVMAALLESGTEGISDADLAEIEAMIERARKAGR